MYNHVQKYIEHGNNIWDNVNRDGGDLPKRLVEHRLNWELLI